MITRVNFSNYPFNSNLYKRNQIKNFNPNFRGILDNPQAKRVTDGNGNTYIVEPGGHIVIHGDTSNGSKAKTVGTAAATGAGTSIAADKISDMHHAKTDLEDSNSHHDIDEIIKNDIDDNSEDIDDTDDTDNIDITDSDDIDEDDDDDDDDDLF